MGTVQNVRNRDQFTLSDNQGSVNVFTNGESRVLQGERLTVIGRVDGAAGGNSIAAEQITRGFESSQNGAIAPYAATGSVSVSENAEQYRARQYNQVAPASGYNEYQADHAYDNRPNGLDRGYEPEAPDNIEYQGSQRTKPYYKGMSMNDYNARVQTRFKGQSRIQPEKGFGE
ncbi:MAG: hypothetical protein K2Q12_03245 [Rickettsiales bacterium]|nr:hypothetical protein [Rickettsiales bacterium]